MIDRSLNKAWQVRGYYMLMKPLVSVATKKTWWLIHHVTVYAPSIPELTTVQNFLQHCFKRKCISYQIDIYNVLEEVDRSLFKKISSMLGHPLYSSVPKTKESSVRLRVPSSQLPRVNTQCLKNSFLIGYFSNIE